MSWIPWLINAQSSPSCWLRNGQKPAMSLSTSALVEWNQWVVLSVAASLSLRSDCRIMFLQTRGALFPPRHTHSMVIRFSPTVTTPTSRASWVSSEPALTMPSGDTSVHTHQQCIYWFMCVHLLCRSEQANLDTLKREHEQLRRKGNELRDLAAKNKVSVRPEWRKEGVPALSTTVCS